MNFAGGGGLLAALLISLINGSRDRGTMRLTPLLYRLLPIYIDAAADHVVRMMIRVMTSVSSTIDL